MIESKTRIKTVSKHHGSLGRVTLPPSWVGKVVEVRLLDEPTPLFPEGYGKEQ